MQAQTKSTISTKVSDTLFSMFTKYRDNGLRQLSNATQNHTVEEMAIQLSIILAMSYVSGGIVISLLWTFYIYFAEIEDELVDITARIYYRSRNQEPIRRRASAIGESLQSVGQERRPSAAKRQKGLEHTLVSGITHRCLFITPFPSCG
jgi:hypothetical protein